jgi:hypothetical protein
MTTDINQDPPRPADEKDVIIFYDSEGKAVLVLPADDVLMIIPDHLLSRRDDTSRTFSAVSRVKCSVEPAQVPTRSWRCA